MKKLLAASLLYLVAACASSPQSPQQAVFAAKSNYAVALAVAVAYKKLPVCAPASPPLCSKPSVVATLQKVDTASFALVEAAENTVRTEGAGANAQTAVKAANEAVAAFLTITQTLQTK